MSLHPVNEVLAGVEWTQLDRDAIAELTREQAGALANSLYAGITRANIPAPSQTGVNLAHSEAAANVWGVLNALRGRAGSGPEAGAAPSPPPEPVAVAAPSKPTARRSPSTRRPRAQTGE